MIRVETARSTPRPQAIPRADFPYLGAPMERILVVEDDRAVQKALKRLFESEGFAVEISADGKSALDAFRATGPAAIVLDLRLPSMSGRDVCREIKQQSPAVPVIVLSAASDVSDKVLLLELGADDYVTKPFSPRELLARVRAALRRTTRTGIGEVFAFDGISVDFTKMEVTRDGQSVRSEEHTSELQSLTNLVCRLLLEKKNREHVAEDPAPERLESGAVDAGGMLVGRLIVEQERLQRLEEQQRVRNAERLAPLVNAHAR